VVTENRRRTQETDTNLAENQPLLVNEMDSLHIEPLTQLPIIDHFHLSDELLEKLNHSLILPYGLNIQKISARKC